MELRLFGGLRANDGAIEIDLGRPRQRLVLAILAIECGQVVGTDRLIELLWPEDGEKKVASVQAYVSNLRKLFADTPDAQIVRQLSGYRLAMGRTQIDVLRFEDHVMAGRKLVESADSAGALDHFDAALRQWVGPPLPEFDDEPIVVHARLRWQGLLAVALESIAQIHLDGGNPQSVLLLVEPRLDEFPLRERLHSLAALALYRCGRQTEALRVIDRTRQTLLESSGLDVGDELRRLENRILTQDPELLTVVKPISAVADGVAESREVQLFGREAELGTLRSALAEAALSRGGVVTVTGVAGIGKSALVEQFTDDALIADCNIAWGRFPDGGVAPPFWPLVQIESRLRAAGVLSDDSAPIGESPQRDPFLFAQRLAEALRRAAGTIIIVLDDLQWADDDTLRVLVHLVAELRRTRILVVLTSHPPTADATPDAVACAAQLTRLRVADITLGPLGVADVRRWLAEHSGMDVPESVAAEVCNRTGGNPLFVRELVELVRRDVAGDALVAALESLPAGLIAVIRKRVAALPPTAQHMLTAASVLGASAEIAVVADIVGIEPAMALEHVSEAAAAGFVSIDVTVGSFEFSHRIVSQALMSEIAAGRLAELHAAAARSQARRHPDAEYSSIVAYHAVAGAMAGTAVLAIEASRRAARHALARGAFIDAAQHSTTVSAMLERFFPEDRGGRLDALISAARAHERADQMDEAQARVINALDLARGDGDPAVIESAVSVLTHASIYPNQSYGDVNATLIALLQECLADLPEAAESARATVLAAIGTELFHSSDVDRRDQVIAEALEIARGLDDAVVLARVLHASTFSQKSAAAAFARRAAAAELAEIADTAKLGDDVRLMAAHQIVLVDYGLGNLVAAQAGMMSCIAMLDRPVNQALRSQIGFFRALIETVRGNYDGADGRFEAAVEMFRRSRPTEADAYRLGQILTLGHDRGDLPAEVLNSATASQVGGYGLVWQLYTAVILFDMGRAEEAVLRIPYRRGGVPERPDDYTSVFVDVAAAHIAAETSDVTSATLLLDRLLPMAGRWAGGGSAALVLGPVDLALGRLYLALGQPDEAERWFASAVLGDDRMASPAWLARSLLHQARFMDEQGRAAEAARSFDRAAEIAADYRLTIVASQLERARR